MMDATEKLFHEVEATDIATMAHDVYLKFHSSGNPTAMHQKWVQIFGGITDDELYDILSMLRTNLYILTAQIESIAGMNDRLKKTHVGIVNTMIEMTKLANMGKNSNEFLQKVNTDRLSNLLTLSMLVKDHYPRPELPDDFVQDLISQVEDIIDDIARSDFPEHLKIYLRRNARKLLICLRNVEILGVNSLADTLARVAVSLRSAPAVNGEDDEDLNRVAMKFKTVIRRTNEGLDHAEILLKRAATAYVLAQAAGAFLISKAY